MPSGIKKTDLYKNKEEYLKTKNVNKKRGIGIAAAYQGGGLGVNIPDYAQAKLNYAVMESLWFTEVFPIWDREIPRLTFR